MITPSFFPNGTRSDPLVGRSIENAREGKRLLARLIQQNGQHLELHCGQISRPGQQQDLTGRPALLDQKSISID
tara:strand:+ start:571 stop:792 length:222 start_codon:yes stop_codon:yes gene_type:complete